MRSAVAATMQFKVVGLVETMKSVTMVTRIGKIAISPPLRWLRFIHYSLPHGPVPDMSSWDQTIDGQ
jgi:hypothetical protein